jgi:hypothetical protein
MWQLKFGDQKHGDWKVAIGNCDDWKVWWSNFGDNSKFWWITMVIENMWWSKCVAIKILMIRKLFNCHKVYDNQNGFNFGCL